MFIKKQCTLCGCINEIKVKNDDYQKWIDGTLIQNAFVYLSSDELRIISSGVCKLCWKKLDEENFEDTYIGLDN